MNTIIEFQLNLCYNKQHTATNLTPRTTRTRGTVHNSYSTSPFVSVGRVWKLTCGHVWYEWLDEWSLDWTPAVIALTSSTSRSAQFRAVSQYCHGWYRMLNMPVITQEWARILTTRTSGCLLLGFCMGGVVALVNFRNYYFWWFRIYIIFELGSSAFAHPDTWFRVVIALKIFLLKVVKRSYWLGRFQSLNMIADIFHRFGCFFQWLSGMLAQNIIKTSAIIMGYRKSLENPQTYHWTKSEIQ